MGARSLRDISRACGAPARRSGSAALRRAGISRLPDVRVPGGRVRAVPLSGLPSRSIGHVLLPGARPGVNPARDGPGAHEMPDPNVAHKVVFDLATAAPKPGDVHPMLRGVALRHHARQDRRSPPATGRSRWSSTRAAPTSILQDEAFKARHEGQVNPNIALIQGVEEGRRGFPRVQPGGPGAHDRSQEDSA